MQQPTISSTNTHLSLLDKNEEHLSQEVRVAYQQLQLRTQRRLRSNYPRDPPYFTSTQYRPEPLDNELKIFHADIGAPIEKNNVLIYPVKRFYGGVLSRGSFLQCTGAIKEVIQPVRIIHYDRTRNFTILHCTTPSYREFRIIMRYRDIYWTMAKLGESSKRFRHFINK